MDFLFPDNKNFVKNVFDKKRVELKNMYENKDSTTGNAYAKQAIELM